MNIYTQICGLVIMAMLLFFYNKQPTLGLSSEKRFKAIIYVIIGCVLLDIASCYFIVHSKRYPEFIVLIICKLYLASLHCVAFSALAYTVSDIFENFGTHFEKFIAMCYQSLCLLGLFITAAVPIYYFYDGYALYSYGPAAIATYIFVAFYIMSILTATIYLRQYIKPKKIYVLIGWMMLWILSAIIQFLHPSILIVSFAACVGALIIYFELENPQSFISRRTGHFSSAVIREYFDYLYQSKKRFALLMVSFKTVGVSSDENELLRKTINLLSDFLFTIEDVKVFDTAEGYFLLVFNNTDFVESTKFKISTFIQSVESNPDIGNAITLMRPYYTVIPDSTISDSADELLLLLANFIPSDHNLMASNEVTVDLNVMEELKHQKHIEKLVIDAMENERVEVHYQPIYEISSGKFTSAEALVRIKLPDGTYLQPNAFIPIVEFTGRIIPLSDAIYRRALSFINLYHIERLGVDHIELNLSVKQGESPIFATKLLTLIDEYNINPSLINLEVTETSSLKSQESLFNNMKKLEEHGFTFSLDDFGSGSSNLNYIVDMPVSIVKLDKHLSDEYFENTKAQAIVTAVIEMAHSMGIKIIAEGIETQEEFSTMKELGVDYIQGFYFSKPLPEHEFLKFMQTHNL